MFFYFLVRLVCCTEPNLGTYFWQPSEWSSFHNGTLSKMKKSLPFRDYMLISQSELELSFPNSVVRKAGFKELSCAFFLLSFSGSRPILFCTNQSVVIIIILQQLFAAVAYCKFSQPNVEDQHCKQQLLLHLMTLNIDYQPILYNAH